MTLSQSIHSFGMAESVLLISAGLLLCLEKKRTFPLHCLLFWTALTVLLVPFAVKGVSLYSIPLGALLHVVLDAFSDRQVPVLLKKGVCFSFYKEGDPVTEDTFTWVLFAACVIVVAVRGHLY
jgi:hypothetical protein